MDLILERYKEGSNNVFVVALRLSTYACPFYYQSGTKSLEKGPNFISVANLLAFYYFHGPYDLKAMDLPTWTSLQLPP